ncbi:hypothetical protein BJV74DRAFT_889625 [Russula compacta]|nr:hypothetical protein BJV74DRAFT_889625 [Russula compacta]
MQRASEKRQLEALVITKGKFKTPIGGGAKAGEACVQSTAAGNRSVISDVELDILLDRRKEVFEAVV